MLSHRRRTLLTLASYGTWDFDLTSFPYVYNSLLTKGSEVVKGKIAKIYANGEVLNQLIRFSAGSTTLNGVTAVRNSDQISGYFHTDSGGATAFASFTLGGGWEAINGHKYLCISNLKNQSNTTYEMSFAGSSDTQSNGKGVILSNISGHKYAVLVVYTGFTSTTDITFCPQVIDLTQMFPFDTPTTLTDKRVQNLLNRGYIAYNQGEYKGTNVGEIATEPYNLLDLNALIGGYSLSPVNGNVTENANRCVTDFIAVHSGSYSFKHTLSGQYWKCCLYDKNKTFVRAIFDNVSSETNQTIEIDGYIRIGWDTNLSTTQASEDMVVVGSTLPTTYKPHKPSASISFIYQGNGALNAHDTMEITSNEYVFTKNVSSVDLGSLNYTYVGTSYTAYSTDINRKAKRPGYLVRANAICNKLLQVEENLITTTTKTVCINSGGNVLINDSSLGTDATQVKSSLSDYILYYELATPQVIRIPRKRLVWVDLSKLNLTYYNDWVCWLSDVVQDIKKPATTTTVANIYCSNYPTIAQSSRGNTNSIFALTSGRIGVVNGSTTIQPTGWVAYETDEEVADIATRIFTENGGTVTTDSEVLPNLDLDLPIKV